MFHKSQYSLTKLAHFMELLGSNIENVFKNIIKQNIDASLLAKISPRISK